MSAGIYIHVPFCAVKCPYCDFYSEHYSAKAVQAYTDAVCRNLRALPEHLSADTLYFGGGTPSLLPDDAVAQITGAVSEYCNLSPDAEITLEANPLTVTEQKLTAWKKAGINRLSLGIQSFDADVLRQLGRKHTPEQGVAAVKRAAAAGFRNLSIDLMLGLSLHTASLWQQELETAVSLPVTHISPYLLKIEEGTPFGAKPPAQPDDDTLAALWMQMHNYFTAQGFVHYEISNFAKSGFESRHNCKYWRLMPYYGIGPAAHSCYGGKRYAVPRDLEAFCKNPLQKQELTEPNAGTESERIMLGLRMAEGIALEDVPDSREMLLRRAKPLCPDYLQTDGRTLRMTPQGWLVSNTVLTHLL
ncbi:MAG: radical SAM family heme chaperone HemW [Oscillospiraceae bacterium]|nr:radical SAM family heme chaperone HemW [Oscillospiraceae bacterium]